LKYSCSTIRYMCIRVRWIAFFEKFKNSVVLKVAYVYHNQLLFYNFLKFWDLPLAHWPWRLEIFIVLFLLANCSLIPKMYMVCICMLAGQLWRLKNSRNFQIFSISFLRWTVAVRTDPHRYKICKSMESGSNLQLKEVPYHFKGQPISVCRSV
jgi:hypothetical protein